MHLFNKLKSLPALVFAAMLLSGTSMSYAQGCYTNSLIINTGYDPAAGTPIPLLTPNFDPVAGHEDPHWRVTAYTPATLVGIASTPGGIPVPLGGNAIVVDYVPGWAVFAGTPGQEGGWINCLNANYFFTSPWQYGPDDYGFTFTRSFYLCSDDSVYFDLNIASDNYCSGIWIDGNAPYYSQASPGTWLGLSTFLAAPTSMFLTAGWHTINVSMIDYNNTSSPNYDGMAMWGTVSSALGNYSLVSEADGCDTTTCERKHPCADARDIAITASSSTADSCTFTVTTTVSTVYSILGYRWTDPNGNTIHYSHANSDSHTFTIPRGTAGSVTCTVYIIDTSFDRKGPCCEIDLKIRVDCPREECCFDERRTHVETEYDPEFIHPCMRRVVAYPVLLENCEFIGYEWVTPTFSTGLTTMNSIIVDATTPVLVEVWFVAVNANGDTCRVKKTILVECEQPCCFDEHTFVTVAPDQSAVCQFIVTANPVMLEGCEFIGYIWETPTFSMGPTMINSINVDGTTPTPVDVWFIAVNAAGDTCKMKRSVIVSCEAIPGTGGGNGASTGTPLKGAGTTTKVKNVAANSDNKYMVYPNPTGGTVTVSSPNDEVNTVDVIDVHGKKVGAYNAQKSRAINVSLEKLPAGTYLLRINGTTSKVVTKK